MSQAGGGYLDQATVASSLVATFGISNGAHVQNR